MAIMWNNAAPQTLAARLSTLFETLDEQRHSDRADRATRTMLAAIAEREPATLGAVALAAGRGAPATSWAVETLVQSGLVDRAPSELRAVERAVEILERLPK